MRNAFLIFNKIIYKIFIRRILFLFDSERIHESLLNFGEAVSQNWLLLKLIKFSYNSNHPSLRQSFFSANFDNPVGLAAGFDYNAQIVGLLPSLNFGYGTIGTITYSPYEGNPRPRLGRLVKSKSLLVNKGFKNFGIKKVLRKLKGLVFTNPVGLSIGRTNSQSLNTTEKSIGDILKCFRTVLKSDINFSYYELNISCPNLFGKISLDTPKTLKMLLEELSKQKINKPIFVKMPTDKTDKETLALLEVIARYRLQGVIIGNLNKDRQNPAINKKEVSRFKQGSFSGKPTEKRTNELIKLAYKNFGSKLLIIGCGGIFSGEDAYVKIRNGASLLQLITGLIFEGPQLVSQINHDLRILLKRDGFKNIGQAVGADLQS